MVAAVSPLSHTQVGGNVPPAVAAQHAPASPSTHQKDKSSADKITAAEKKAEKKDWEEAIRLSKKQEALAAKAAEESAQNAKAA